MTDTIIHPSAYTDPSKAVALGLFSQLCGHPHYASMARFTSSSHFVRYQRNGMALRDLPAPGSNSSSPLEQFAWIPLVGVVSDLDHRLTPAGNYNPNFKDPASKAKYILNLVCPTEHPIWTPAFEVAHRNMFTVLNRAYGDSVDLLTEDEGRPGFRLMRALFEAKGTGPVEVTNVAQWRIPTAHKPAFSSTAEEFNLRSLRVFDTENRLIPPHEIPHKLPGSLALVTVKVIVWNINKPDGGFKHSAAGHIVEIRILENARPKQPEPFGSAQPFFLGHPPVNAHAGPSSSSPAFSVEQPGTTQAGANGPMIPANMPPPSVGSQQHQPIFGQAAPQNYTAPNVQTNSRAATPARTENYAEPTGPLPWSPSPAHGPIRDNHTGSPQTVRYGSPASSTQWAGQANDQRDAPPSNNMPRSSSGMASHPQLAMTPRGEHGQPIYHPQTPPGLSPVPSRGPGTPLRGSQVQPTANPQSPPVLSSFSIRIPSTPPQPAYGNGEYPPHAYGYGGGPGSAPQPVRAHQAPTEQMAQQMAGPPSRPGSTSFPARPASTPGQPSYGAGPYPGHPYAYGGGPGSILQAMQAQQAPNVQMAPPMANPQAPPGLASFSLGQSSAPGQPSYGAGAHRENAYGYVEPGPQPPQGHQAHGEQMSNPRTPPGLQRAHAPYPTTVYGEGGGYAPGGVVVQGALNGQHHFVRAPDTYSRAMQPPPAPPSMPLSRGEVREPSPFFGVVEPIRSPAPSTVSAPISDLIRAPESPQQRVSTPHRTGSPVKNHVVRTSTSPIGGASPDRGRPPSRILFPAAHGTGPMQPDAPRSSDDHSGHGPEFGVAGQLLAPSPMDRAGRFDDARANAPPAGEEDTRIGFRHDAGAWGSNMSLNDTRAPTPATGNALFFPGTPQTSGVDGAYGGGVHTPFGMGDGGYAPRLDPNGYELDDFVVATESESSGTTSSEGSGDDLTGWDGTGSGSGEHDDEPMSALDRLKVRRNALGKRKATEVFEDDIGRVGRARRVTFPNGDDEDNNGVAGFNGVSG
ncbi:hypothetical protein C8R46DRAFT_1267875 [Mycena filopes]|nr:hypothetical protein C8R46DRAFT_1267875 [Mycena filopes]